MLLFLWEDQQLVNLMFYISSLSPHFTFLTSNYSIIIVSACFLPHYPTPHRAEKIYKDGLYYNPNNPYLLQSWAVMLEKIGKMPEVRQCIIVSSTLFSSLLLYSILFYNAPKLLNYDVFFCLCLSTSFPLFLPLNLSISLFLYLSISLSFAVCLSLSLSLYLSLSHSFSIPHSFSLSLSRLFSVRF